MPIYEFLCQDCNTIFNFFSRRINTEKRPDCPKCGRKELKRMMSSFATIGNADNVNDPLADVDEAKMEKAFEGLLREAEHLNEDDPKQMASLMRKFSDRTGMSLGERMEEALSRLESGEDPDRIEQEFGDIMDDESGLNFAEMKKRGRIGPKPPHRDDRLHELE